MFRNLLAAAAILTACTLSSARAQTQYNLNNGSNDPNYTNPPYAGTQAIQFTNLGTDASTVFHWNNQQPTGTGVIDTFLRIQNNGTEQGYNTDAQNVPFDDKSGPWTHALLFSSLQAVDINGQPTSPGAGAFYRFLLDVNQNSSQIISMDRFEVWMGNGPSNNFDPTPGVSGISSNPFTSGGQFVYSLDKSGADSTINIDFSLNSGSGSGDMYVYIPTADFTNTVANPYVYLYSSFGVPGQSNDGFEEWAATTGNQGVAFGAPEPSTLALAFSGLVASGFAGLRRYRRRGMDAA